MQLIYVFHHFLEDFTTYLHQFTISDRKNWCRTRGIVYDSQVTESVAVSECSFFLSVDFYLAYSLKDNIVGSTFVTLAEDIGVSASRARFHLFIEAVDFLLTKLREYEMFLKCFFDFDKIVGTDLCLIVISDIVLDFNLWVSDQQCIFASTFFIALFLDDNKSTLWCLEFWGSWSF